MTKDCFDWDEIPDFIIGRSGYDLYLVETAYLNPDIHIIDVTIGCHNLRHPINFIFHTTPHEQ